MSFHHIAPDQVATIPGPAKVHLTGGASPALSAMPVPTVVSLAPNTAVALTGPDLTMIVTGTNFNSSSVITFGGLDEPTTLIDATHVSTVVKPSLFAVAVVPVKVRNGSVQSPGSVNFTFTATRSAAEEADADEEEVEEVEEHTGHKKIVRRKKKR